MKRRALPSRNHDIRARIIRYLAKRAPMGVTSRQIDGWLRSVRAGYTLYEIETALTQLRDEYIIRCVTIAGHYHWWLISKQMAC